MKTKLFFTLLLTSIISFGQDLYELPLYEGFDYSIGSMLLDSDTSTGQGPWVEDDYGSSKNPSVIASPFTSYSGLPTFTGNAIEIIGGTNDPLLYFKPVTENDGVNLYASCMIKVTDMSALSGLVKDYFFALSTDGFGYGAALYFAPVDATTYNLGINESNTSSEATIYTGDTFTENVDEIFVVIKYEFNADGNSVAHLFINPTINGTTEPASTADTSSLKLEDESNRSEFTLLKINANSNAKTPGITIDEIRIGTSWEDVTNDPSLGLTENQISNFKVYPNPATNYINIESSNEKIESVDIYNVLGGHILSEKGTDVNRLDISFFSKGVYFVKVKGQKSGKIIKKIVVN
ncbi:T9SS type A sorting domain-containing protein [Formosa sp. PL04]|uniref:T9SS type A sorting domain-containing protein n=1 Tax=Formosa sp. PL04 TaxID=3081755 RepID=UPI002982245F|nr:T9SS type A sorting domain-containing protein [Formosa sp. PL04]MDW5289165.1 T9SS type A sorting domain-containing protein [Formosa sp. PL04]